MTIYSLDVLLSQFWVSLLFHVQFCCFLTGILVSQEAGKVVWYSHLFKNFPQFVVIHTVKGFGVVNKAKVDVSLEFSSFFYDLTVLAIWSLFPLLFSKSSLYIWKFSVHVLLKPSLEDFEHDLASMWKSTIMWLFEHSLALPFFEIGMKTDIFQSCGHCWVFKICWHIECSTLRESSFRIWAGILSLPLALIIVMLPKACLTLHSRMSGSRWVIIPTRLSMSFRFFCIVLPCIFTTSS